MCVARGGVTLILSGFWKEWIVSEAIQQDVTVEQTGVIVIRSPRLSPGARARVTVVIDDGGSSRPKSLKSLIGSGHGCFDTPDEADEFLRRERDTWS